MVLLLLLLYSCSRWCCCCCCCTAAAVGAVAAANAVAVAADVQIIPFPGLLFRNCCSVKVSPVSSQVCLANLSLCPSSVASPVAVIIKGAVPSWGSTTLVTTMLSLFGRCNTRNKQTPTNPPTHPKKKKTFLISKESLLQTHFVFASQLLFVLSQLI